METRMKITRHRLFALLLASSCAPLAVGASLTQYVDPMIGTLASSLPNTAHGGNTLPAAGLPHGMVQWGPNTTASVSHPKGPAGYYYDAEAITGFPLAQLSGAGCSSNGEFPFMPAQDSAHPEARFRHADEQARPGYYAVRLANGIGAELTATLRSGMAIWRFPAGQPALLVLDAGRTHSARVPESAIVTQVSPTALSATTVGGNFCESKFSAPVYLYAQFDQAYTVRSYADGKAVLEFAPGATVQMKAAISYVSIINAQDNLAQENPGWDFAALRRAATEAWETRLGAIEVEGGSPVARTKFYTALYHALWGPTVFSDANGQYPGLDGQVHQVAPGQAAQYSNFSAWDSYRSQMPLQALLAPQQASDMAQSLLNAAGQCGSFPSWLNGNRETGVMPGANGALVLTQAYTFGARAFDAKGALAYLRKLGNLAGTACQRAVTTPGKASYLSLGYIAQGEWDEATAPRNRDWVFCLNRSRYKNRCNADGELGPASTTLEYGVADFAAARFAAAVGDTRAARQWHDRAGAWRSLLSPAEPRQLTARYADGSWGNPADFRDYVEGTAEQYLWMVPFNAGGLVQQLGGAAPVRARLDRFFTELQGGPKQPFHYMGNQPSFAVPWLYNWAGAPAQTQAVVRRIMDTTFTAAPDGLPGSDDLGAMSAWYVWGALGLYPSIPGVAGLAVSSPQFERIVLTLGNGRRVELRAAGAPDRNYIQSLALNGKPHARAWFDMAELEKGAQLDFAMGSAPSAWGATELPPSFGVPDVRSVAAAANNQAVAADGSVIADGAGADFDGQLHAYSAQALAAAGARPGKPLRFGGASVRWPSAGLDNVLALGQTIELEHPGRARTLVVLAAANHGPSRGEAILHYADGGQVAVTLAVDDWTLNEGKASARSQVALALPYRIKADGRTEAVRNYVFDVRLPLDPKRTLRAISLPGQVSAGRIHVFGIALAP
jgi:predicted alpha-1,2-mannosidase